MIGRAPMHAFATLAFAALTACASSVAANPETNGQGIAAIQVDSAQLVRDVAVLSHDSLQGRAVGTPGNALARTFIESRFRRVGLQAFTTTYAQPFTFTRSNQQTQGTNVVGWVRGTALPDRYIVITAHYDHVGVRNGEIYNGADDNASGTAALLALADHFARSRPRHSMIFVAFDAEENGLRGARAFVETPPVPKNAIILNINMDMVGRNDAGELYVAGTHPYPHLLPAVQRAVAQAEIKLIPGHDQPIPGPRDDWTSQSDQGAFHAAGIPFLYFGVEDHPDYHRPTDDFERIQQSFFVRAVRTIINTAELLDSMLD
jgi:Zn-dependent M28 family amino/carboxypeptidase